MNGMINSFINIFVLRSELHCRRDVQLVPLDIVPCLARIFCKRKQHLHMKRVIQIPSQVNG